MTPNSHLFNFTENLESGVDFDDAEYGFKEEDKDLLKVQQSSQTRPEPPTNNEIIRLLTKKLFVI